MQKQTVLGNTQLDPYGHGKLASRITELPGGSIFVARAIVWLEAICTKERYWIHQRDGSGTYFDLWCEIEDLSGEYYCCARIETITKPNPEDITKKLISDLWNSRISRAMPMSLQKFDLEGLLSQLWLNEFTDNYHDNLKPPEVPSEAKTRIGKVFYEGRELRYQGEQWNGIPHGKGTGYWENGNVWCDGFFRNNKPHGECNVYFPNGTLRHEGNFVEGYPEGIGKEYYDNGQLWFEGVFHSQTIRYGWGARRWIKGKLYDREGKIKHDGEFVTSGFQSVPAKRKKGGRS